MYVQGRGTLFDIARGCVVGEEEEAEGERERESGAMEGGNDLKEVALLNDSILRDKNNNKVQAKEEVEKEVEKRVEEEDNDEGTLYLLVDSLFLLEELAMPSSLPYIQPPVPAPPSIPSSPSPSTPSPSPTSSLSTGPGLSVSSIDITSSSHRASDTDIGDGIGNGIGSEGTDISNSISIPINAISPHTSHSEKHSIPITNSVTVSVDTLGTVISSSSYGNGITSDVPTVMESTAINQEIETIRHDKQGEGKGKKKNKLTTETIPGKKERENFNTPISSITITEIVTNKTDLTGNTINLKGVLVTGKKSSKKKKKERVEGVDYMEFGLPRKNLNLVDDIVSLEIMIKEMQEEILDNIDKEIEMEENERKFVLTNNVFEDENNQNNQKKEKKDKKELKENTSKKLNNNELPSNQKSSLSATLRVVGFDCEWRPEHYFERKIVYSNGGKGDINGQNKNENDVVGEEEGVFDCVGVQQTSGGGGADGGGVSHDINTVGVDIVSCDVSLISINNNNINNIVSKNEDITQNTHMDKNRKQNNDEEIKINGKRKLISPMGKKNKGSNKRNKIINEINNDFEGMELITEYSEITANNQEIDRIENHIKARSDLRKLAAESDNLISNKNQINANLLIIGDRVTNIIDEFFISDDNMNYVNDEIDESKIKKDENDYNDDNNDDNNESKDEILRTNNTSWGRFDVPRGQRRRDQTQKGTGTGPGPARMASPVMLLQVD